MKFWFYKVSQGHTLKKITMFNNKERLFNLLKPIWKPPHTQQGTFENQMLTIFNNYSPFRHISNSWRLALNTLYSSGNVSYQSLNPVIFVILLFIIKSCKWIFAWSKDKFGPITLFLTVILFILMFIQRCVFDCGAGFDILCRTISFINVYLILIFSWNSIDCL